MNKIILDTNILLLPGQHKLDVFSECERLCEEKIEFLVLQQAVEELKALVGKRSRDGVAARIALQLLLKHGAREIKAKEKKVDEAMLALAKENKKIIFATNDVGLRRRLRSLGARTICLKHGSVLGWC